VFSIGQEHPHVTLPQENPFLWEQPSPTTKTTPSKITSNK